MPALMETQKEFTEDLANWITLKMVNDNCMIIGAIRYKMANEIIEVGKLMIHPQYRNNGFAKELLSMAEKELFEKQQKLSSLSERHMIPALSSFSSLI